MKVLGLDLGSNSIGWGLIDLENNEIIDSGVRIFIEGVENIGQGDKEISKNAARREFRQSRRQYFRKKLRKIKLLELLIKLDMCPLSVDSLKRWKNYDSNYGSAGRQFPDEERFNLWLRLNPYYLRDKASREPLLESGFDFYKNGEIDGYDTFTARQQLGRILFHLIQRRGFQSNRKVSNDNTLSEGKSDKGIVGIKDANDKVGADKDYETLGQYLYDISRKNLEPYKLEIDENGKEKRVRARYTLRQMYIDEFEIIWSKQAEHLGLTEILETMENHYYISKPYDRNMQLKPRFKKRLDKIEENDKHWEIVPINRNKDEKDARYMLKVKQLVTLKDLLGGGDQIKRSDSILFYQRPLRVQKHLLDECQFEKTIWKVGDKLYFQKEKPKSGHPVVVRGGKKPCPKSHPLNEIRRALEFINNIEYGDRNRLDEGQRKKVLEKINKTKSNLKFKQIKSLLYLENEKFNYEDDFSVKRNSTHAQLMPLFKKSVWEDKYEEIWHCFHFFTDYDKLYKKLQEDYGLDEKYEDEIKGKLQDDGTRKKAIILDEGYSSLSLKAIKNILPFLEMCYHMSDAVLLGGVKNAFGKDRWESDEIKPQHDKIIKKIIQINSGKDNKEGDSIDGIKQYLIDEFDFEDNDTRFFRLYHHSQKTVREELQDKLDEPKNIRNPIVQQVIHELRSLVNEIACNYLEEGEKFYQIKVEMARNLKQSKELRSQNDRINKDNKLKNDKAREVLDRYGLSHSRRNIHKYLLWEELRNESGIAKCPYTGKTISLNDLLYSDNKFQIEHIVPYSVSLDDSFSNKTICEAEENGRKGERTPYQFYGHDKKKWYEARKRAFDLLPYHKAKRFTQQKSDKDDFLARQLNDTGYISREASHYLKRICSDVQTFPGQLTSELRRMWGLNAILNPPITIDDPDFQGKAWAEIDSNDKVVNVIREKNAKPYYQKGQIVITGEVKNETFSSTKYLAIETKFPDQPDGKYWAVVNFDEQPIKLIPNLRERPETKENEILIYGRSDKDGNFVSKLLNNKQNAELESDKSYFAKLTVIPEKTKIRGREKSKIKKKDNQIVFGGYVSNGKFESDIYHCTTNQKDGVYYAEIEVDLKSAEYFRRTNDKPDVNDKNLVLYGNVENNRFRANEDRHHDYDADGCGGGEHWAIFTITSEPEELTRIYNEQPDASDNTRIEKGTVSKIDVITGEILEDDNKAFFIREKGRVDHRHHAVDALVVALTEKSYLQRMSTQNAAKKNKLRGKEYKQEDITFPMPWPEFRKDAEESINNILVSYKKNNKLLTKKITRNTKAGYENEGIGARGLLHKESVYGERTSPENKNNAYHIKKPLESIKIKKHINKIVDRTIRELIYDHIREHYPKINVKNDFTVPGDAFFITGDDKIRRPRLFLPNENGEAVPIKKVRIRETIHNAVRLKKENQFVNPRNNSYFVVYMNNSDQLDYQIIPFWNAIENRIMGNPVISLPKDGIEIVEVFQKNDMFLLGFADRTNIDFNDDSSISDHLFKVQKIAGGEKFMEICFRHHLDSRKDSDAKKDYKYIKNFGTGSTGWFTFNPIKVRISRTGKLSLI